MRLPGSEKVIVGYDLGNKYAQISCYVTGSEEEIRTLSSVAGSSVYTIPLALSKRQGVNQWFYGSEAIRYAGEEEGILVENLLKLATLLVELECAAAFLYVDITLYLGHTPLDVVMVIWLVALLASVWLPCRRAGKIGRGELAWKGEQPEQNQGQA